MCVTKNEMDELFHSEKTVLVGKWSLLAVGHYLRTRFLCYMITNHDAIALWAVGGI